MKKIVIIGAGFSGLMICHELLRLANNKIKIILVEKTNNIAKGIAYSTEQPEHLLNVCAGKMSAFDNKPNDFVDFLKYRYFNKISHPIEEQFVPRMYYGKYLESIYHKMRMREHNLEVIKDQAINIKYNTDNTLRVKLSLNKSINCNHIILATGNPNVKKFPADCNSEKNELLINTPWNYSYLNKINDDMTTTIVGTGLTMVDVCLSLHHHGYKGKINAISRHGYKPLAHPDQAHTPLITPVLKPELKYIYSYLRKNIKTNNYSWYQLIDSLRPITQELWLQLSNKDKARFFRHSATLWSIHRHRIAPEANKIIERMTNSGQLTFTAGSVEQISTKKNNKFEILYNSRKNINQQKTLSSDVIINCTGPSQDYNKIPDRFFKNLINDKVISSSGYGINITKDGEIIQNNNKPCALLSIVGPPCKGKLFEIIAVPDIRKQYPQMAKRILSQLNQNDPNSHRQVSWLSSTT